MRVREQLQDGVAALDPAGCYRALVAHDPRYDGLFFVGVSTTGIYCRPVCRARTPAATRCVFFRTAAQAEQAGFRACLRCRPELAPGASAVDALPRLVQRALARIDDGALDAAGADALAGELGVSGRHLRRALRQELGLTPAALARSRRLALARQLLSGSRLPVIEIAHASGFRSLRRFNAAVRACYGRTPSALRGPAAVAGDGLVLSLAYRPPLDWDHLLAFLAARAIPGVEQVSGGVYRRAVTLGGREGWVSVTPEPAHARVRVELAPSLLHVAGPLAARVRRLLDLDAQPDVIEAHLSRDPRLSRAVKARPGLRVPGFFEPFEGAARAVLGQQVSVAAASTLAGRLVAALGTQLAAPAPHGLTHLPPAASAVAGAPVEALRALGLPEARARTLRSLARVLASGRVGLEPGADPERTMDTLLAVEGIGPWTASYLAMRGLGWPDAFPAGDLGVRKALGGLSPARAVAAAEGWRPWRAYAVMHLWAGPAGEEER